MSNSNIEECKEAKVSLHSLCLTGYLKLHIFNVRRDVPGIAEGIFHAA